MVERFEYQEPYENVIRSLRSRRIPTVLIGGAAMVLHGSDRLTKDVDIVTRDLKTSIDILYECGFQVVAGIKKLEDGMIAYETYDSPKAALYAIGLRRRSACTSIHTGTNAKLDVWVDPSVPMDRLEKNATPMKIGNEEILVASPEDIIQLKKDAIKDNPKRAGKDLSDIEYLKSVIRERDKTRGKPGR